MLGIGKRIGWEVAQKAVENTSRQCHVASLHGVQRVEPDQDLASLEQLLPFLSNQVLSVVQQRSLASAEAEQAMRLGTQECDHVIEHRQGGAAATGLRLERLDAKQEASPGPGAGNLDHNLGGLLEHSNLHRTVAGVDRLHSDIGPSLVDFELEQLRSVNHGDLVQQLFLDQLDILLDNFRVRRGSRFQENGAEGRKAARELWSNINRLIFEKLR